MTGGLTVREAAADDGPFLAEMLVEAFHWRPADSSPLAEPRRSAEEVLGDPVVARYVVDWPRPGDAGVVAEEGGRAIGAAWWRHFTREHHGFGFVDDATPEVSIAVAGTARGRGVGTALLAALVDEARQQGKPALSLSVETDNPAVRLYERVGFVVVERDDGAFTMLHALGRA